MSCSKLKKKGTTTKYLPELLELALKEIREDEKGIRETCRKYGIPRSTVQDRLSGKREDQLQTRGPEPVLGLEGEKRVVDWLITIAKCGFPIKKQELLDTVQKILKDLDKPNPFKDDRPGQTWYTSFMKRHAEISSRVAEGINKARANVTEESIRLWFRELEKFLEEEGHSDILLNPQRIFNADESGFSLCPKTGKVIGPKGYRNLYQVKTGNEKDNLTVLMTFNASGDVCPPLIVFPYLRPPKAVSDSMPPDWCLGRSESGWMKSEVFFEYMTNDFNAWVEEHNIQKPILFLVDGHKSHMSLILSSMCEQLGIILYALPPNTTHMLQPADVSVFGPLKAQWRAIVRKFLSKPENVNKSVTKTNFCPLLKEVIENPTMKTNIVSGFRKCGLYPFHPDAVDYTKCVKNTIENLNQAISAHSGITEDDIISTRKVLRYLKPILKKNKTDLKVILKEIKKLRKSITKTDLHGSQDKTDSILTETTESAANLNETHCSSPCLLNDQQVMEMLKDATNDDSTHKMAEVDDQELLLPIVEKFDEEISTLHISGLEQGTLVSLDDIIIIPIETSTPTKPDDNCSTAVLEPPTISFAPTDHCDKSDIDNKAETLKISSKQNNPSVTIISDVIIKPATVTSSEMQSKLSPLNITGDKLPGLLSKTTSSIQHDSEIIHLNTKPPTNTKDVFAKHLFQPQPTEKSKEKCKPRIPASISSKKWREYHEQKEKEKIEKQKLKIEKQKAQVEKKEATKRKREELQKKKIVTQQTKKRKPLIRKNANDIEICGAKAFQGVKQKCTQCTTILNSDTEDEENKNIGCDFCTKWFHLKCTDFVGLSYDIAKDRPFKCNSCITEE